MNFREGHQEVHKIHQFIILEKQSEVRATLMADATGERSVRAGPFKSAGYPTSLNPEPRGVAAAILALRLNPLEQKNRNCMNIFGVNRFLLGCSATNFDRSVFNW